MHRVINPITGGYLTIEDGIVTKYPKADGEDTLLSQVSKIHLLKGILGNHMLPEITSSGFVDNEFYYKYRYIDGIILSQLDDITVTYDRILSILKHFKDTSDGFIPRETIEKKIHSIKDDKIRSWLLSYEGLDCIPWSVSHGDFTLENILVEEEKITLIDPLDNVLSSYVFDVAKFVMDIRMSWSRSRCTEEPLLSDLDFARKLIQELSISEDMIDAIGILQINRITPYLKSRAIRKNIIEKSYEYIDRNTASSG